MLYDIKKLAKLNKVGIMGGTFNPVHMGHLVVAEAARERFDLDIVLFIPSGTPPHKDRAYITSARHRLNMLKLAVRDNDFFKVSNIEAKRTGTSYSIDTIREIRRYMKPGARLFFIVGSDTAALARTWKEFELIEGLAEFIVYLRPGYPNNGEIPENAVTLRMPMLDISSSDIRDRIHQGRTTRYIVPDAVNKYIHAHHLYRLCKHTIPELVKYAEQTLSPKRYDHTLGVYETAAKLSIKFGADEKKTVIAALLHDCAKEIPAREKVRLCERYGIKLTDFFRENIDLIHSFLGAKIAYDKFGIRDKEILNAIKYHTTGRGGMSLTEKIVYIADCTEPHRKDYPALAEIREAAHTDIDKALELGIKATVRRVRESGQKVHPYSIQALKYIESNRKD